jgi:hypothetical protein
MRAFLAASIAILALAAAPASAAAQWADDNARDVWAGSMGMSALPDLGMAFTGSYGRIVGFGRLVLAADAIVVDDGGPYNLEQADGRPVCADEVTHETVNEENCLGHLTAAARGEVLFQLPGAISIGPAIRFDGTLTPYGAVLLERRIRRTDPWTWFAHAGAGLDYLQIDIGVSLAH